jgi:DNA-binding MarR family transcriptional regulator
VRIEREPAIEPGPLAQRFHIPLDRLVMMEDELASAKLITRTAHDDGARRLTPAGCAVLDRLLDARRAHLADLIAEWPIEQRDTVRQHLRAIAEGLVPDVPRNVAG